MSGNDRQDPAEELSSWLDRERSIDRRVRRVSKIAWTTALVAVILYGILIISRIIHYLTEMRRASDGDLPPGYLATVVLDQVLPLVAVVGVFSFLVAVLSTIGMFLRFRTASLAEVQTRLTAMEKVLQSDTSHR
jgi:peptidoglycan biosynthesis protein MviN/MurJ (putative lipid II flippase)